MSEIKDRKIFEEIIAENFQNLLINISLYIPEPHWMPSWINAEQINAKTHNSQNVER